MYKTVKKRFKNVLLILLIIVSNLFGCLKLNDTITDNKDNDSTINHEETTLLDSEEINDDSDIKINNYENLKNANEKFANNEIEKYLKEQAEKDLAIIKNKEDKNFDRIIFVGDVFLSRLGKPAYDREGGINNLLDKHYKEIIKNSDLLVGNMEGAITDNEYDGESNKQYLFSMPKRYTKALKEIGFDIMSLANNHTLDFGTLGLMDTINSLKNYNIDYIGAGYVEDAMKPIIKEINGRKYAFFAATQIAPKDNWYATDTNYGLLNGINASDLVKSIKKTKSEVDKVIVFMHWGEELKEVSNNRQKDCAKTLVNAGADLIIGSHPHVVEEIEFINGVPVVYSLGNFIFGLTWKDTMLLQVDFYYDEEVENNIKPKERLTLHMGVSGYEKTRVEYSQVDRDRRYTEMNNKCTNCFVASDGLLYSVDELARLYSENKLDN